MPVRPSVALLAGISFAALLLPLLLANQLAWQSARAQALQQLDRMAEHLLNRSEKTRSQVMYVLNTLKQTSQRPCSAERIQRMRELAVASAYVRGIGYVRNGRLLCSTLSTVQEPLTLGKAQFLSEHGMLLWSDVALANIQDQRFNLNGFSQEGYVAVISPELALDVLPKDSKIVLAHVGARSGQLLRVYGVYRPHWFDAFSGTRTSFQDNDYLVQMVLAESGHTVAIAAMPIDSLRALAASARWYFLPWGLLVGVLFSILVYLYGKDRLSLKGRLQAALSNSELQLLYQPVIDLSNGRCIGAEALLRWYTPTGESISPDDFITVAEQRGLMRQLTEFVLKEVAEQAKPLFALAPNVHIAINFSAQDFHSPWLLEALHRLIANAQAAPHNIIVEATERGFMEPRKAQAVLSNLRKNGFKVAIDDFGTGSSSLSYLANYELDYLKLDKLFVSAIGQDCAAHRIALQIIEMAHSLKLNVIAEGVETCLQHSTLCQAGVSLAQGYIYAKPLPMEELLTLISSNASMTLAMTTPTRR